MCPVNRNIPNKSGGGERESTPLGPNVKPLKSKKGNSNMRFLKAALLLNASSCIIFGTVFLAFGSSVNQFIGNSFGWVIPVLGAVLLFNGLHLVVASRRSKPVCPEILYFVVGDLLWVVGTLALVSLGLVITSTQGAVASLLIAAMVGTFGGMQVVGYKRVCSGT